MSSSNFDRIVEILKDQVNNDMRVAQVMSNVFYKIAEDGVDPFFVEDAKLVEYLEKYVGE